MKLKLNRNITGVVYGEGMVAKALRKLPALNSNYFAAGVSNSVNARECDYEREVHTMSEFIRSHDEVTYFSSFVAIDGDTRYAQHKRQMEDLVTAYSRRFRIVRLPQAVGVTNNETLINTLVRKITGREKLFLLRDAKRRLISVDDVARISFHIASRIDESIAINVGPKTALSPLQIAIQIAKLTHEELRYTSVDGGDEQTASLQKIHELLGERDAIFLQNYQYLVLENYVPLIAKTVQPKRAAQ